MLNSERCLKFLEVKLCLEFNSSFFRWSFRIWKYLFGIFREIEQERERQEKDAKEKAEKERKKKEEEERKREEEEVRFDFLLFLIAIWFNKLIVVNHLYLIFANLGAREGEEEIRRTAAGTRKEKQYLV